MMEVKAQIKDNGGKQRFTSINIQSWNPQAAAREIIKEAHIVNGSVRMGYMEFDYPSQSFKASECVFEVKNGELEVESLKAIQ